MATKTEERIEFVALLAREYPERDVAGLCRLLMRHAKTHERIAVTVCNVEMSEKQAERLDKKDDACEARIKAICEEFPKVNGVGVVPQFGGDPRGYTVKITVPSKRFNTWGGAEDGIGVPAGN